jgi:hypothetical protein
MCGPFSCKQACQKVQRHPRDRWQQEPKRRPGTGRHCCFGKAMPTYMHHFQCVRGEACLQYHTARRTQQRLAVSGQRRGQRLQQKAATKCNRATLACVLAPSSALTSPDTCQLNHLASLEPACARGVGRGGVGGVGEGKGWWVHCVHTLVGSRAYARSARIVQRSKPAAQSRGRVWMYVSWGVVWMYVSWGVGWRCTGMCVRVRGTRRSCC